MTLGLMALAAAVARTAAVVRQGVGAWLGPRALPAVLLFLLGGELLMATVPAIGAVVWWKGRRWGHEVMLLGLGAVIYASVNAIGWALVNQPALVIGMAVGLVVALGTCANLIVRPDRAFVPRTWRRALLMGWLLLSALQIYGVWTVLFVTGVARNPLAPQTDTSLVLFRDLAELTMIVTAAYGAWAWARRSLVGTHVALVALGMLLYAALNTTSQVILVSLPWVGLETAIFFGVLAVARALLFGDAHRTVARASLVHPKATEIEGAH